MIFNNGRYLHVRQKSIENCACCPVVRTHFWGWPQPSHRSERASACPSSGLRSCPPTAKSRRPDSLPGASMEPVRLPAAAPRREPHVAAKRHLFSAAKRRCERQIATARRASQGPFSALKGVPGVPFLVFLFKCLNLCVLFKTFFCSVVHGKIILPAFIYEGTLVWVLRQN